MKELMYKLILPIVIFFLVAISPLIIAIAHANDRVAYLNAIMPNMIGFITDVTEYENKGYPLPEIVIVNAKDVCEGAYQKEIENVDECDIAGYYNDDTNTIYIRDEPTRYMTDDRYQEVILVHELVHFLQKFSGTYETIECKQALETDAYNVQSLYIDLMGIDEKNKPDPLFAIISAMCPGKQNMLFFEEQ